MIAIWRADLNRAWSPAYRRSKIIPTKPGLRGIWQTLCEPNYARYISGNGISLVGTWMQRIAVGWLTWELTHSPAWLGIIAMADFFPVVLMGPLGGALADRVDRVRIMISAQAFATIAAFVLFGLAITGAINEWYLAGITFCTGAAVGLNQASRLALAPSLVPREQLPTAIAINSMTFNLARFIGPVASAAVIKIWGIEASFAVNGLSYLALIIALLSLKFPNRTSPSEANPRQSLWLDIREGMTFTLRHPAIRLIMIIMTTASLCLRPIVDLLPGLASDVFGQGVDGFATLIATLGAGALLGGFWMAQRGKLEDLPRVALLGILCVISANAGLISTSSFVVALICIFFTGFGMVVSGIGVQSTLQFVAASHMRGRVLSLYGIIHIGGAGVGAFVLGLIAELTGLQWPIAGGAIIGLMVWIFIWARRKVILAALSATIERTSVS